MAFRIIYNEGDDFIILLPEDTGGELSVVPSSTDDLHVHKIGMVDQLQELEDETYAMLAGRWLDDAIGAQLDQLGLIVDLARRGAQADDEYRTLLRAKVLANRSCGTPETLVQIALLLLADSDDAHLIESFPGAVIVNVIGSLILSDAETVEMLDGAAAAGVRLHLVTSEPGEDAFAFDGPGDNRDGFGDATDPDVGGQFASLVGE